MEHKSYEDDYLRTILLKVKTIALIGASNNPARPSNGVLKYLLDAGYDVIPVNPKLATEKIHNQQVKSSLAEIKTTIDMVDIFRNTDHVPPIIEEALALSLLPKVIWMQLGVIHQSSAKLAEASGLKVVMDRCPKIELNRLNLASSIA